jgi:hypothetical protein
VATTQLGNAEDTACLIFLQLGQLGEDASDVVGGDAATSSTTSSMEIPAIEAAAGTDSPARSA